jgi:hypothetical protein
MLRESELTHLQIRAIYWKIVESGCTCAWSLRRFGVTPRDDVVAPLITHS